MNKNDIALLYEYDRWATNRVLQSASALTQEQLTRDLGGSFCSLRDTLLHIIEGVWGWLTYWKEPLPNPAFLKDLQDRRSLLFRPTAFPDLTAICRKWTEVEREQIQFVDSVTEEALAKMVPVRGTHVSLAHLMQHLANHSTYHRGQISLMMRQLEATPLATDFHVFLLERSSAPVRTCAPAAKS